MKKSVTDEDEEFTQLLNHSHTRAFSQPVIITEEETRELRKEASLAARKGNNDISVISEDDATSADGVVNQSTEEVSETFEEINNTTEKLESEEPVLVSSKILGETKTVVGG
ncbi:unnamed protein product [Ambrosiozyma monospora]|uniref:Unnamed protein product n=1 Tax=Ambrosiozyma monospora TaxID=43982 RepID=A0ACB5UAF2_AMBMO|nr:unnamed protein product [Ambrosiozyma monospora]